MRAIAVHPSAREVGLVDLAEPAIVSPAQVKIRILEVGVCATDREICHFEFGAPPAGEDFLVLGHESLGEVVEIGPEVTSVQPGDLVIAMVRRPCGVAGCLPCAAHQQDFCSTGQYWERGINYLHGFMTNYVVEDETAVFPLPPHLREFGVLTEPLTVAEKALIQVDRIQSRFAWGGKRTAVVLGAGPVGLLGAMALRVRGFEVVVYSREAATDTRAALCSAIGARYVSSSEVPSQELAKQLASIDLVYEAVGNSAFAFDMLQYLGVNGIFVFAGGIGHCPPEMLNTDRLMRNFVLKNQVVVGTVNAGRDAFRNAIADLEIFGREFPGTIRSLITRRYEMEDHRQLLLGSSAGGIKNVIRIAS